MGVDVCRWLKYQLVNVRRLGDFVSHIYIYSNHCLSLCHWNISPSKGAALEPRRGPQSPGRNGQRTNVLLTQLVPSQVAVQLPALRFFDLRADQKSALPVVDPAVHHPDVRNPRGLFHHHPHLHCGRAPTG